MSRNIGDSCCYFCGGKIAYDEKPRPITKKDAGYYFDEYCDNLIVAASHCEDCQAKYLAWFNRIYTPYSENHCDLSFLSTFDDEPGTSDLPLYDVEVKRVVRSINHPDFFCVTCQKHHPKMVSCDYWCAYHKE